MIDAVLRDLRSELKAARAEYEAATAGEWQQYRGAVDRASAAGEFDAIDEFIDQGCNGPSPAMPFLGTDCRMLGQLSQKLKSLERAVELRKVGRFWGPM